VTVSDVNDAPRVGLTAGVADLGENTDTPNRIKVADIVVSDDALGSNLLSLAGTDSALFEIIGNALYLKAGTVLDFEVQDALTVAVRVDDPSVGGSPDDQATLLIGVLDVNDAPVLGNLENTAASYAAGDAPVAVSLKITVDDQDDTYIEWAVVRITANYRSGEDILHFTDTANISGSWDEASGSLMLTGTDTVAAYQAALRSVVYENLSATPNTITRTVALTVDDGDLSSNTVSRDIGLIGASLTPTQPTPAPEAEPAPTPVRPSPETPETIIVPDLPVVGTEADDVREGPEPVLEDGPTDETPTGDDAEASGIQVAANEGGADVPADALGEVAVGHDPRRPAGIAKPGVMDALSAEVAALIQNHAGLLERLASAPVALAVDPLVGALSIEALRTDLHDSGLTRELDRIQEDLGRQALFEQATAGTVFVSSTSLAVGYVMWLFRGGALLSGFLSSMAAWQLADPLPVLAHALARRRGEGDDDDDSLESLVKKGSEAAREKRGNKDDGD